MASTSNVNIGFSNSSESSSHTNSFKQRRKTTPANILLTAPKPFKSLTNTYDSQRKPIKNVHDFSMDCTDGSSRTNNKNSLSSSTLPSTTRYQQQNDSILGRADDRTKDTSLQNHQELPSPSSEPPPILPRR